MENLSNYELNNINGGVNWESLLCCGGLQMKLKFRIYIFISIITLSVELLHIHDSNSFSNLIFTLLYICFNVFFYKKYLFYKRNNLSLLFLIFSLILQIDIIISYTNLNILLSCTRILCLIFLIIIIMDMIKLLRRHYEK